jgi:hypothetical protein
MPGRTRAGLLVLVGLLAALCVAGQCEVEQPRWEVGVGARVRLSTRLRIPPEFALDSGQPGIGPVGWPGIRVRIGRSVIGFGLTDYGHTGFRRDERGFFLEGLTAIGHTFTEDQKLRVAIGLWGKNLIPALWAGGMWWRIGDWLFLPWAGIEADIFTLSWLRIAAETHLYFPTRIIPKKLGIGLTVYVYPLTSRLFEQEEVGASNP